MKPSPVSILTRLLCGDVAPYRREGQQEPFAAQDGPSPRVLIREPLRWRVLPAANEANGIVFA
jgi:hypothetical protein